VENVPHEDARLIAIDFCKYYGINRDKILVNAFRAYKRTYLLLGEGDMIVDTTE
jgi:hypothetical protein